MKVFKGYLMCVRGNLYTILLYSVIFLLVSIFMVKLSKEEEVTDWYKGSSISIGIVDQDKDPWAEALAEYFGRTQKVRFLEDDKEGIAEALYNHNVNAVIKIPSNFRENCLEKGQKLEVIGEPDSIWQYYVTSMLDQFVNSGKVYLAGGYSEEEAINEVLKSAEMKAKVLIRNPDSSVGLFNVFRFMPYLYFSILCFTMGVVRKEYQKLEIRRRLMASSMSLKRQNLEMLLAFLTVGVLSWILCEGIGIAVCGREFWESPNKWYILFNGFTIMLAALCIAFLIGNMAKSRDGVNGLSNVFSLSFCFLGGVFVPLEMFSGALKSVGQFFPTYWYSQNISLLSFHETLEPALLKKIYLGFLIQLVFAAACTAAALMVSKAKRQEE